MAGRIKESDRATIDFLALPEPTELEFVPAIRSTVDDIPAYVRAFVDRAVTRRKVQVQQLPNGAEAEEFARLCLHYGRLHEPVLTVRAPVHNVDGFNVHVTAWVRQSKPRKYKVNAPVTDPNDAMNGVPTTSTPKVKQGNVPEPGF